MKINQAAASLLLLTSSRAYAAIPALAPVDLRDCANFNVDVGGPIGFTKGNTPNNFADLSFYLLDPNASNNTWTAGVVP